MLKKILIIIIFISTLKSSDIKLNVESEEEVYTNSELLDQLANTGMPQEINKIICQYVHDNYEIYKIIDLGSYSPGQQKEYSVNFDENNNLLIGYSEFIEQFKPLLFRYKIFNLSNNKISDDLPGTNHQYSTNQEHNLKDLNENFQIQYTIKKLKLTELGCFKKCIYKYICKSSLEEAYIHDCSSTKEYIAISLTNAKIVIFKKGYIGNYETIKPASWTSKTLDFIKRQLQKLNCSCSCRKKFNKDSSKNI